MNKREEAIENIKDAIFELNLRDEMPYIKKKLESVLEFLES